MSAQKRRRASTASTRGKVIRNEGQRALLKRPETLRAIAAELGVAQMTLSRWASGKMTPSRRYRAAMREIYGIPEESWDVLDKSVTALFARRERRKARAKEARRLARAEEERRKQIAREEREELIEEARRLRDEPGHAWIRERGRIECARCGMRAHWQGANDPCAARALGAKRDEDVLRALRTRGVPSHVAARQTKVVYLGGDGEV